MDDSPFRRLVMISAISATDRKLLNINFQEKNILCLTFSFFDNIFLWLNVKRLLYYNYDCKSTNFALMKCKNKIFFFFAFAQKKLRHSLEPQFRKIPCALERGLQPQNGGQIQPQHQILLLWVNFWGTRSCLKQFWDSLMPHVIILYKFSMNFPSIHSNPSVRSCPLSMHSCWKTCIDLKSKVSENNPKQST